MRIPKRKIAVVGLGYVGLPVAIAFGKVTRTIGYDISKSRVAELRQGLDGTQELGAETILETDVLYTSEPSDLKAADFYIVAVPTPIDATKAPDLEFVIRASVTIGRQLDRGDIVVFESTVYPGVTERECIPLLEENSGLRNGVDFFVGYSPERINPGDTEHSFSKIKKVVAAQDEKTLEIMSAVYSSVVSAGVYRAASIRVAEAAKAIENTQRDLNIALMNELAVICQKAGIDTQDVLAAAGTKWNFLSFKPGLVGGHCIGVDPYYLTHMASEVGISPEVILAGRSTNDGMGHYIAEKALNYLKESDPDLKRSVVTVLGMAFKENIADIRNSKVVDIIRELESAGVEVQVADPRVSYDDAIIEYGLHLTMLDKLKGADLVMLAVPHQEFVSGGWPQILRCLRNQEGCVFDIKGVLNRDEAPEKVVLWRL